MNDNIDTNNLSLHFKSLI